MIRLALSAILFAASLLTVLSAPSTKLWLLEVVVTEWGYVLALLALVALALLLLRPRSGALGFASSALVGVAAVLFLTPLARAIPVARRLPADVASAFGAVAPRSAPGALARSAPLSAAALVGAIRSPRVRVTTETYGSTVAGGALRLDLYRGNAATPAPLVIIVHGGSWSGGVRGDLAPLNRYLAARGYVVASPDYRLAPAFPFPAGLNDVRDALTYLRANAARFGIDTGRVVLMGRSAGGEIALTLAYTAGDPGIKGAVGYYSPVDLRYAYANPSDPHVLNSGAVLRQYLGGPPAAPGSAYDSASPINFVGAATVPTLLVHGARDELVSAMQSQRLDSVLARAGVPHLLVSLPWATHGCDYNLRGPCGQIATYALERFLAAVTR